MGYSGVSEETKIIFEYGNNEFLVREFVSGPNLLVNESKQDLTRILVCLRDECIMKKRLNYQPSPYSFCLGFCEIECGNEVLKIHFDAAPSSFGLAHKDMKIIVWAIKI